MSVLTATLPTQVADQIEDRCAPRVIIRIPGMLRKTGTTGFSVVVRDLSIAGFSCEAVTSMPKGALCWLTLPGLAGLQSEVIWNDGRIVGCAFANLMHQSVLDRILAQAHR
jgi:hypothetical protein